MDGIEVDALPLTSQANSNYRVTVTERPSIIEASTCDVRSLPIGKDVTAMIKVKLT